MMIESLVDIPGRIALSEGKCDVGEDIWGRQEVRRGGTGKKEGKAQWDIM